MQYYNAIITDPLPVLAAMRGYDGGVYTGDGPVFLTLAAAPGLNRWDYDLTESKLRQTIGGGACMLDVTLRQPEAGFLVASGGKYLLLWTDEYSPAGKGRVLGFGRIDPIPSSIGNADGKVSIDALCRPEDWQRVSKAVMKGSVVVDSKFYDQDSGPSVTDYINCSTLQPVIDRRTHQIVARQNHARIDVDITKPPGQVSANGVVAYDVTDYARRSGFDLRKGSTLPIKKLATKMQVAWTQFADGTCDLAPSVSLGVFNTTNGSGGGFFTYTPDDFKQSFPAYGAALGTGWKLLKANLVSVDYTNRFYRSASEPNVAAALADNWGTLSTSGSQFNDSDGRGAVLAPYAFMRLAPGVNVGMVAWYEYAQARRETVTMITTLLLDPLVTAGLPTMTGAKVGLGDPTEITTGAAWLPNTPYAEDDISWFGGRRRVSLVDQVSGPVFDSTLWAIEDIDDGEETFVGVYYWTPGNYFVAGAAVHPAAGDDRVFYRNFDGYSSFTTWASDAANWTEGPKPRQAMSARSPMYLGTTRGAKSLAHLDQRHTATLIAAGRCFDGVFRMNYDDLIDPANDFRAMDLSVGHCLRVRTTALTSGIKEVIGVITSWEMTMGPRGAGAVSITIALIPGTGLTDPTGSAVAGEKLGAYTNPVPRTPINVDLLWNPTYSCTDAHRTGMTFSQQGTAIQAAIDATSDAAGFSGAMSAAIGPTGGNRAVIKLLDLVQEGLIPLQFPTMTMKPKLAPRNIAFA